MLPGARFVPRNDVGALEQAVGPNTAGIVLEMVQGEGGIYPMTTAFVRQGARAGRPLQRHPGVRRNPVRRGPAGHLFRLPVARTRRDAGRDGGRQAAGLRHPAGLRRWRPRAPRRRSGPASTEPRSAADPLACRTALEFFDILDELLPTITSVGGYFRMRLTELAQALLVRQGSARLRPDDRRGAGLPRQADRARLPWQQGLLINCTHDIVLRFLPPYIVTEQDVDRAISVLNRVFKKTTAPEAAEAH